MKIEKLIGVLSKYPPDTKIRTTWEGICRSISISNIYQGSDGVVYIDADDNVYKKKIKKGRFDEYPIRD